MNTAVSDADIVEHLKFSPPQGYPYSFDLSVIDNEICLVSSGATFVKFRNNTAADLTIVTYDWNQSNPPSIYGIQWE